MIGLGGLLGLACLLAVGIKQVDLADNRNDPEPPSLCTGGIATLIVFIGGALN